ncbi:hypothetical protein C8F01DRAFT_1150704 [Mycena amicta]|nr:hypothetical protein C8F01DRAFT_1150704 [Mycena amicta]
MSNPAIVPEDECFLCKKRGSMQRCSRCHSVQYCSKDCQKLDWKQHKTACQIAPVQSLIDIEKARLSTAGQKPPNSPKNRRGERSSEDVLADLKKMVEIHAETAFGAVSWYAMDLAHNFSRSTTHFVGITLSRNVSSNDPLTLYSLVDVDVLPFSVLKPLSRSLHADGHGAIDVVEQFKRGVKSMVGANPGIVGGVMILCVELAPKDQADTKNVEQAICEADGGFVRHTLPLNAFSKTEMAKMPVYPKSFWEACLKNALDGYAFAPTQQSRMSLLMQAKASLSR